MKKKRWNQIINECQKNEQVSVKHLVEFLNLSEATVRRDLQEMEDLGLIIRYHGGAKINCKQNNELPMEYRFTTNKESKNKVARYAASLIKDNQMIYIDAGSTTFEMIDYIYAKNITVVTIGIPHIISLSNKQIRTIILGGNVRTSTSAISGSQTLKQLNDLYFDMAFIGVNGIDERAGLTTTNNNEAMVKNMAISHSKKAYFLADNSKFNMIYPESYAKLNEGIVITDDIPDNFDKNCLQHIIVK